MNNRIYGYCRISTRQQSIERQIRNIREAYPDAVIVEEIYTGTSQNHKKWRALVKNLKTGDMVVFDSVSRMSRNAEEGFEDYEKLYTEGIELVFLKEPHINTEVYRNALNTGIPMTGSNVDLILEGVNRYLMVLAKEQIRLAFIQSEKEVMDLRKRTSEGILTAKLNGKQVGNIKGVKLVTKKSIASKKIIKKHSKYFDGTLEDADVIKLCGIGSNAFYKYKRELKTELNAAQKE